MFKGKRSGWSVGVLFSLLLFFLIFSCGVVLANDYWYQFGNMDYGDKKPVFASLSVSEHNVSSPFSCSMSETFLFSPVVADLDNDGVNSIVFAGNQKLLVYDFACNLEQSLTIGADILSMPVITNIDYDDNDYNEVAVHTANNIFFYEFNVSSDMLVQKASTPTLNTGERGLSCNFAQNRYVCVTVESNRQNLTKYVWTVDGFDSVTYDTNKVTDAVYGGNQQIQEPGSFQGYGSAVFLEPNRKEISFLMVYETADDYWLTTWDMIFGDNLTENRCQGLTPFSPLGADYIRGGSLLARIGSSGFEPNVNVFSGLFKRSASTIRAGFFVLCDKSGTARVEKSFGGNVSNWACGDFTLNGANECCIMHHNQSNTNDYFECYDQNYLRVVYALLNSSNRLSGLSLADFDDSNDYLEVVTSNGIYSFDGSDFSSLLNLSGPFDYDGSVQTVIKDSSSGLNYNIYTEDSVAIVFGFEPGVGAFCGDGVCQDFENELVCFSDCWVNETGPDSSLVDNFEPCVVDSDCESGYCIYGFCSLKEAGVGCEGDWECASGYCDPISHKCTKPSLWDSLTIGKEGYFGDDVNTNNLISIAIIVFTAGPVMVAGGVLAVVGGIFLGVIEMAFFAFVGWLSAWIFVVGMIVLIIGGFVVIFLKAQG